MKKIISLQIFMALTLLIAGTQKLTAQSNVELWGTLSSGGSDNLGTLGHYNPATSTWITDYVFKSPYPGANPEKTELMEANGKLYGMTKAGGLNNGGIIFEWVPSTNAYIKKFDFGGINGLNPCGSLTYQAGKFYGMTFGGGASGGGVIFEWDPVTNIYTKRIDLNYSTGSGPMGSLSYHENKFYGITSTGGAYNAGVAFEWDPSTNVYSKRVDFNCINGCGPHGSLTLMGNKFYGMTRYGGVNDFGVIFEWDPATNAYAKKVDFDTSNGTNPQGSLSYNGGKFYGLTVTGGANDIGVIFEWDPNTNIYTKKFDFNGLNGHNPFNSLTYNGDKFYGLTQGGGYGGTLFEWDPETNVYTRKIEFNGVNGASSHGNLTYYQGKFYGMTWGGGGGNTGVIFEWDPLSNLHSTKIEFNTNTDGSNPVGSLAYLEGKFYGMTSTGGVNNVGVLFEWDPTTQLFSKKVDFSSANGTNPQGSLIHNNGKLYGMTSGGGFYDVGVIFEWNPITNAYNKKIDLNCSDGCNPRGSLTYHDGKFYGMTNHGGVNNSKAVSGVIFEWDPVMNTYIRKFDLSSASGGNPYGSLTCYNGKFYGTTYNGGSNGVGVIFEWDHVSNVFTKKVDFIRDIGMHAKGTLTNINGKFYGTTYYGGTSGFGALFEWDPLNNIYTKKLDFSNGFYPSETLTYDGVKFFGTTFMGGVNGLGILFEWSPITNIYNKRLDFSSEMGGTPNAVQLVAVEEIAPTVQASNISISNVHSTYMDVSFTPGNGSRHLVVMKAGSAPTFRPIDNTSYSGNLGNGESVVYNGTDNTFRLTNLQPNTEYFITIFEFNTYSTTIRYLTDNPPLASKRTLKNIIDSFSLIYFKTREVVSDFNEMVTLDVADPDIKKYTIRANTTAKNVGSVKFMIDGIQINIDNSKPYTINYWVLPELSAGVHTFSAQAFSNDNAQGRHYEKRDVFIIITNSAAVTQFDIVDKYGNKIRSTFEGDIINVGLPEMKDFNIIARTNISTVLCVRFELNGDLTRIDNRAPYGLSGTENGYEKPLIIYPGPYILKSTPFMKYNAWGPPGIPLTINFTVIDEALPSQMAMRDELLAGREIVTLGSSEELSSQQLRIYPIPVKDELHILLNDSIDGKVMLKVMDINGRFLYSMEGTTETIHGLIISTNQLGLSSGLYILCIQNQSGKILRTRFLKE